MNKNQFKNLLFGLTLILFACSESSTSSSGTENKTIAENETTYAESSTCDCESTWFDGTSILTPPEGKSSPFGASSTINCLFHQWSWQKFLFITQVEEGQTLPYFIHSMDQVTSEMDPVPNNNNLIILTENTQAGGGGILTTNEIYDNYETIYYSLHINSIYKNAAETFKSTIETTPDSVNNRSSFPIGALELKVSWVNVNALPENKRSNYFITKATIDGASVNVALLGMHVVGVVKNHPEFIWATFEHNDLAGFYNWDATTRGDVPVSSTQNLPLFNNNNTASLSDILWTFGDTTKRNPNNVFTIFKYGTPRVAGGGYMTNTSQSNGEDNYTNIDHLNQSVHDTLTAKASEQNILWTNYFYNGSLWMNTDGMSHKEQIDSILARVNDFGDANTGGPLRGSVNAFNITMETYEQTKSISTIHNIGVDSLMNCFTCHGPSSYQSIAGVTNAKSPTYISHLFMNYMHEKDPNATVEEIRKTRLRLFNIARNK